MTEARAGGNRHGQRVPATPPRQRRQQARAHRVVRAGGAALDRLPAAGFGTRGALEKTGENWAGAL